MFFPIGCPVTTDELDKLRRFLGFPDTVKVEIQNNGGWEIVVTKANVSIRSQIADFTAATLTRELRGIVQAEPWLRD